MTLFSRIKHIARAYGRSLLGRNAPGQRGPARGPNQRQRTTSSTNPQTPEPERDPKLARYYANLEVPYGADLETVRTAYRRLMKRYHPDRHTGDPEKRRLARQITQGLNEAYRALSRHLS